MDSNVKAKYNLDHVYCHTNENTNYFRTNHTGTGGGGRGGSSQDVISLLKENKQLKAMLLLHLELMQEQSEQIQNRDKLIATLRDEIIKLKTNQNKCTPKSNALNNNEDTKENILEVSKPVILKENSVTNNDTEADTKIAIKQEENLDLAVVQSPKDNSKENEEPVKTEKSSIIGESNGKLISKIILQRIHSPDGENIFDEDVENESQSTEVLADEPEKSIEIKPTTSDKESPVQSVIKSDSKSEQEPILKNDSEESLSSEHSIADDEQSQQSTHQSSIDKKIGFMQTKREYKIHEWDEDDFNEEFNIEDADALKADAPMLEIPKWIEKEFTGKFSVEGTEDLSDEAFLKRHSKLEHDEKKRKKWDVQRIREQKTIERLKRRHCKDELQEATDNEITSFYPPPETIKFIEVTDNLPVLAFGVGIPCLSSSEFSLPWTQTPPSSNNISTRHQHQQQQQSQSNSTVSTSSFVFLKKRRRIGQPSRTVTSLGECSGTSGIQVKHQV